MLKIATHFKLCILLIVYFFSIYFFPDTPIYTRDKRLNHLAQLLTHPTPLPHTQFFIQSIFDPNIHASPYNNILFNLQRK